MARARGDFFLLLNSDAFPKPGAIAKLLREIQLDSNVAMVGPRLLNADGSQQTSVFAAPSPVNTFKNQLWINAIRARWTGVHPPPATPQLLPGRYLSGACLLVRREVYDQIGGFDERFFFYCEDADWQRRVQRRWQIRFVPAAEVTHVHGGSGRQDRLKYSLCAFDANELFVLKHYGIFGMACVRCCVAVGSAARLLRYSGRLPSMWRGKQVADFPVRLCWNLLLRQFRPPALKR
jgi:GT2 family glycosyltransferase